MTTPGPDCGHEACLFEPVCIVVAADLELAVHRADVEHRRRHGVDLATRAGVPELGRAFEALCYGERREREAAGRLIVARFEALAAVAEAAA